MASNQANVSAREGVFKVDSPFQPAGDQPKAIEGLVDGIHSGLAHQTLLGVTGSGKTFTIANVVQEVQRPTIIMAHNKTLAAQLYGEFKEFFPDNAVEYFVSYYDYYQPEAYVPSSDTFIEKDASINEHIEQMRLSATKALLERPDAIIVATVSSIYGLGDPQSYLKMMLHLDRGDQIDQRFILRRLAELQYTRNDVEFHRANYRVRGDVIDVFPAESEKEAIRIELFDDEVENLSYFDPLTGEVLRRVPRVTIYPKSHYVTPRQTVLDAVEHIKVELDERLQQLRDNNRLVEAQRLEERTRYDIEMMLELGYCNGIENYSRYLSGRRPGEAPPTLFDYLPPNALLVVDESHVTIPQIGAMYKGDRSRKETLVEYGFRLPSALDNRPMKFEEWERIALSEINARVKVKERVLVTTLTKRMAEDLTDFLMEHDIKVRYLHSDIDTVERVEIIRDLRRGEFDVLVGINLLREGLDMPEVSLVAILDADKEGFLRSERSLIQTIGRAARNVHGKAILYGDRITGSMQRAIDETERRRAKQQAHNDEFGITPQGLNKKIADIMEGAGGGGRGRRKAERPGQKAAEEAEQYRAKTGNRSPEEVLKEVSRLEDEMYKAASELDFETAARLRDEIAELKEAALRTA